jgi:hypothetical protein
LSRWPKLAMPWTRSGEQGRPMLLGKPGAHSVEAVGF